MVRLSVAWQLRGCARFCSTSSSSSAAAAAVSSSSSSSTTSLTEVDVAIVGGGPVGLAIACGLAQSGRVEPSRLCLLEAGQLRSSWPEQPAGCYSNRAVAFSPSSAKQLGELACWPEADARVCPVAGMRIYESDSSASLQFEPDNSALAYVAELGPIVARLTARAESLGVRLLSNCRVESLEAREAGGETASVGLADGGRVRCRLLIGCDGHNSPVRRLAGVRALATDYNSRALVATLRLDRCHGNVAMQRFFPNGPIALLPLGDNGRHASLVWCSTPERIRQLTSAPEAEFLAELNRLVSAPPMPNPPVLPPAIEAVQADSRASFPLGFLHADRYALGRVALAGDAAHRISPLAGLGANLGLEDAKCLVRLLTEAFANGADPADPAYLTEYETERQRQALPVIGVNEGLRLLYSLDSDCGLTAPLRAARSLGFRLTNQLPAVKDWLRRSATSGRISVNPLSGWPLW